MEQRIRKLASFYCDGNIAQFARSCNIHPSTLGSAIHRGAFGFDVIQSILDTYKDVSAEWLLRGLGNMTKESSTPTICPDGYIMVSQAEIDSLQNEARDSQSKLEELKRDKDVLFEHIQLLRKHLRDGDSVA